MAQLSSPRCSHDRFWSETTVLVKEPERGFVLARIRQDDFAVMRSAGLCAEAFSLVGVVMQACNPSAQDHQGHSPRPSWTILGPVSKRSNVASRNELVC